MERYDSIVLISGADGRVEACVANRKSADCQPGRPDGGKGLQHDREDIWRGNASARCTFDQIVDKASGARRALTEQRRANEVAARRWLKLAKDRRDASVALAWMDQAEIDLLYGEAVNLLGK